MRKGEMKPKPEVPRKCPPSRTELQAQIDELRRMAAADVTVQDLRHRVDNLELAETFERTVVDVQFQARLTSLERLAASLKHVFRDFFV
jgi:hypothetical protein